MDAKTVKKYIIGFDTDDVDKKRNVIQFIEQQEKYAELGRLLLESNEMICSRSGFDCNVYHCNNYDLCVKRAELLAEAPK